MARRASSSLSRKQIIETLVALGKELGRTPRKIEFLAHTGTNHGQIQRHFKSWNLALAAAELRPNVVKCNNASELLDDWGNVTRELGHCPQLAEYKSRGRYGCSTFRRLFQSWPGTARAFYMRSAEDSKWQDVIAIIRKASRPLLAASGPETATFMQYTAPSGISYGEPIDFEFLRNAPVNEAGVVYLFGCLAPKLGYSVEAIQTQFPDCEAKRRDSDGRLRRVRIEFEFESKNFLRHKHEVKGCDVIVCWRHNWEGCPLQVVELSEELRKLKEKKAA